MVKDTVEDDWPAKLSSLNLRLKWLSQLGCSVGVIADFGCASSEFLALLRYLDADKICVINVEEQDLKDAQKQLADVENDLQEFLQRRCVCFILEDMANLAETQLPSDSCDLAYCDEVLYIIHCDSGQIQDAVNQMARVVKPGGYVIAVEEKIGADMQVVAGRKCRVSDPIDISHHFEAAGLNKVTLNDAPEWSYCYQKPYGSSGPPLESMG